MTGVMKSLEGSSKIGYPSFISWLLELASSSPLSQTSVVTSVWMKGAALIYDEIRRTDMSDNALLLPNLRSHTYLQWWT